MDKTFTKEHYEQATKMVHNLAFQTNDSNLVFISDLLQNAITNIEIIEKYERERNDT